MQMGCSSRFIESQILRDEGIWDKKVTEYAYLLGWCGCGCGCIYKFYTRTTGGDVFIFIYLVLKEDDGQHGCMYSKKYSGAW